MTPNSPTDPAPPVKEPPKDDSAGGALPKIAQKPADDPIGGEDAPGDLHSV